jgi:glycosyltransferase involved in cell wall biosynthesis
MRVLHVINGLAAGGAEAALYRLATYPSDVHHEVVCLESRGWYSDRLEASGITVHHLNWGSPASLISASIRIRRLIKESGADIVQGWMYRSNTVASIAGKMASVPVVWNIRSSLIRPLRLPTQFLAYAGGFVAARAAKSVINCSAASREIHARLGYDAVDGSVIPNGYDPVEFHPDARARKATRKALGIEQDTFLVGSIGRWDPHKGYPVLFKALRLMREQGAPARLLLVGRDLEPSNSELMALIESSGCSGLVDAIGPRDDINGIASALDLHVLASVSEGFPNVVAESMLAGTPNVVTDVGDAGLIVGDTGWIVRPGDAAAIAAAVQEAKAEWANAAKKWRKRCDDARQRIVANFSLKRMVEAYEQVWQRVAEQSAPKKVLPGQTGRLASAPAASVQASQSRLKILHIINDLGLGGAETLLYRLATRESANEHVIVSLGRSNWYSSHLQDKGVPLHHLELDSLAAVGKAAIRLNRIVRESRPDIVQCWMYRSNVFGGVIAKTARKPVVWGIHCSSIKELRPSSRAVVRLSGVLARWNPDFIIMCSDKSAEVHDKLGYAAAKREVIYNGYDESVFFPESKSREAMRKTLGLTPGDFAVGSIARWDPLKDIPNLLAAIGIVRERGIPLRCLLVGAGLNSDNAELVAEMRRHGCADEIILLGSRTDVHSIARALDLHLLASRTEAFPNVVAETMLSGTPNAVTGVGDVPRIIGASGWVVPPRDPQRLADAICEAYSEWKDDPAAWAKRREAARAQIVGNYSLERMAEGYERVWQSIAAA